MKRKSTDWKDEEIGLLSDENRGEFDVEEPESVGRENICTELARMFCSSLRTIKENPGRTATAVVIGMLSVGGGVLIGKGIYDNNKADPAFKPGDIANFDLYARFQHRDSMHHSTSTSVTKRVDTMDIMTRRAPEERKDNTVKIIASGVSKLPRNDAYVSTSTTHDGVDPEPYASKTTLLVNMGVNAGKKRYCLAHYDLGFDHYGDLHEQNTSVTSLDGEPSNKKFCEQSLVAKIDRIKNSDFMDNQQVFRLRVSGKEGHSL